LIPMFSYFVRVFGSTKDKATLRANAVKTHLKKMNLHVKNERYVQTRKCYIMLVHGFWGNPQLSIDIYTFKIYDTWNLNDNSVMSIDVFSDIIKVKKYCQTNLEKHPRVFKGYVSKDTRWIHFLSGLENQPFQWWYDQFKSVGQELQSITVDQRMITVVLVGFWEFSFSFVLSDDGWEIIVGTLNTIMLRLTFVVTPDVPQNVVPLPQQAIVDAEEFLESIGTKRPPPHPPISSLSSFITHPPSLFTLKELEIKGQQYAEIALPQGPVTKRTPQELPAISAGSLPSIRRPERYVHQCR